jgi:glycosyltransferase involved in cell wall biosynthesis
MTFPEITAVIPTYRRPILLKRAILSVLAQTYPHLKVCVYDNASGDETEKVVAEIAARDPRVKYHCHPTNIGMVDNFMYGIKHVDTPFFSILSDDDIVTPVFYETTMAGFNSFPSAMFSAMDAIRIDTDNKVLAGPIWSGGTKFFDAGSAFEGIAKGIIPIPWVGTVFRKEVTMQMGLPNPVAGPSINDNFILRAGARFACVISQGVGCAIMENYQSVGYAMDALDGTWSKWWQVTIDDIEKDSAVAPEIKEQARTLIMPNFKRMAFQQVIHGLGNFGNKNFQYAEKAAAGLGECGHPFVSWWLRLLVWSYQHVFFFRWLMNWAIKKRKKRTAAWRIQINQSLQHHLKFLDALK